MRIIILLCAALVSFAATLTLSSSNASAVFWRGITAPTNIDYHGWYIIKEPYPSPCQWNPGERGLLRSAMHVLMAECCRGDPGRP